jgi:YHS domain-containing protein
MLKLNRHLMGGSIVLIMMLMLAHTAWAKPSVNQNWRGVAIKGYDTVAYFVLGKPVKGDAGYSYQWNEATWWFANAEHRDAFIANPEKYAPQYGGY